MNNVVIFCRGIQGSGKTTFAKSWVIEDPEKRVRVSWDDLRTSMGKYWVPSREPIVNEASIAILKKAMELGMDVVIDNMNLSTRSIEKFLEAISNHNNLNMQTEGEKYYYQVVYKDFKTPLKECIKRDSLRENPIGEEVITKTYERYKEFYV